MKQALTFLFLSMLACFGQMPHLATVHVSWDPYVMPAGTSNGVLVLYKATSLGTVYTPFKPAAYFPIARGTGNVSVLSPGTYKFKGAAQGQPLPQSALVDTIPATITK